MVSIFLDRVSVKDIVDSGLEFEVDGDGRKLVVFNSDDEAIKFLNGLNIDNFFAEMEARFKDIESNLQFLRENYLLLSSSHD